MTDSNGTFRPAVIVPAYSRPSALRRLLASLNRAHYPDRGVHLIISLDGGADAKVVDCARAFEFAGGTVEVIERAKRLGLREHILWCGDQVEKYGSVIVLEDDLMVDPWFYQYASHALAAHEDEHTIAGVALYAPRYNDYAHLPFEPLQNGRSAYLMQVPCSWGQAWTPIQWRTFRAWYEESEDDVVDRDRTLPDEVSGWPASSWKKYFASYLSATGRYFVYPYRSYTTNCSDPGGTHTPHGSDQHQVRLGNPWREFKMPDFPTLAEHRVVYDVFMEPRVQIDFTALSIPSGSVAVDFYAIKPVSLLRESDYCLTTRIVKTALATFPLSYRPLEMNVYAQAGTASVGPVSLCRSDQLYDRAPLLRRLRANYRLKMYFQAGPTSGLSLIMFGCFALLKRIRGLFPRAG
jgi:hypothetical protein